MLSRTFLPIMGALAIGLSAAFYTTPSAAEWDLGIEGGTVNRDGQSATRLRFRASNNQRPLTQNVFAEWLSSDGGSGYRAGYQPKYWFDQKLYVFGDAQARVDRPIRIERGLTLIGGAGYRLYDSETAGLGVEAGAGVRSTLFEALPGEEEGIEEQEGLALVRAGAFQELADLLRLEGNFDVLQGEQLGEFRGEVALLYRVSGGAVRLGYQVSRISFSDNTLDPIDDTQTSVSFTYGF